MEHPEELLERARGAFETGDLDQAVALGDRGLGVTQDLGLTWRFRLLKADVALQRWSGEEVLALLDGELPQDTELAASVLLYRARAYLSLERYDEGNRWLEESEKLAVQGGAETVLVQITLRRGYLQMALGNSREAERLFVEARQKAVQSGNQRLQVEALGNLAVKSMGEAQYDLAVERFKSALQAAEQAGNLADAARIMANLGWCYYQLGAYEAALRNLAQAESLSAQKKLPDQENSLGNIGNVHFSLGDFEKAIEFYQRALELTRQDSWKVRWLSNIAASYIELENWASAEQFNNQALDLKDRLSDPTPLLYVKGNAGSIRLALRRYEEAEQLFRDMVAAGAGIDDPIPLWDGLAGLARVYTETGRPTLAEQHYRQALETIERVRSDLSDLDWKISFKGRWIHFSQDYVDFLMQGGEIEKALEVAESNRAVVLDEKVGDRFRSIRRRAAQYRELAKSLDAVFLSYWVAPRRSYGWLVSGDGIQSFELPASAEVERLAEGYRNYLDSRLA